MTSFANAVDPVTRLNHGPPAWIEFRVYSMALTTYCSHIRRRGKQVKDSTRLLPPKPQLIDDDYDNGYEA